MSNKTSSTRTPQRVHLHAYERLSRLCAEPSERDVDVLLLHNSLGEWYAICYDHRRQARRD